MKEINILIIEDNRLLRDGLKAMLGTESNFNVQTAPGNGENVLKIISTQQSDILLIDVGLPDHNNIEFIISLKDRCPDIKIIMMGLVSNSGRSLAVYRIRSIRIYP